MTSLKGPMVRYRHTTVSGDEYVFREPAPGEARELMSFINSVIAEPMSGLLLKKRLTLAQEESWLKSRMAEIKARNAVMLLVVRDGRILGSCDIIRLPGKHAHRACMGVALRKEARGMGLGEAVMRRTLELGVLRLRGLESVELSAFEYNARAIALYRKLGFVEFARVPRSAREGDEYFEEVMMRLEVGTCRRGRGAARRR